MIYRIYWPDLDDYSSHESNSINVIIERGKHCGEPFVVVDDRSFPNGIVYVWLGKPVGTQNLTSMSMRLN